MERRVSFLARISAGKLPTKQWTILGNRIPTRRLSNRQRERSLYSILTYGMWALTIKPINHAAPSTAISVPATNFPRLPTKNSFSKKRWTGYPKERDGHWTCKATERRKSR